jgi:TrmH family RNA methyltransferase
MEVISSLQNERIKNFSKLLNKKYRDLEGKFIVEGEHLVEEAYKTSKLLEIIKTEDYECDIDVPITLVTYDVIKKLSNTMNPQKIMGIVSKLDEREIGNKVLILDELQDPGNLGTIIRSSVAFNIDTIVLSENTVDLYNDKVIRSSEGMLFKINIIKRNVEELINKLKRENYKIYGTKVTDGNNLKNTEFPSKLAFIVGNEGNGVRKEILNLCDEYIYIPMNDKCESLNVAIATSIILYEMGDQ